MVLYKPESVTCKYSCQYQMVLKRCGPFTSSSIQVNDSFATKNVSKAAAIPMQLLVRRVGVKTADIDVRSSMLVIQNLVKSTTARVFRQLRRNSDRYRRLDPSDCVIVDQLVAAIPISPVMLERKVLSQLDRGRLRPGAQELSVAGYAYVPVGNIPKLKGVCGPGEFSSDDDEFRRGAARSGTSTGTLCETPQAAEREGFAKP